MNALFNALFIQYLYLLFKKRNENFFGFKMETVMTGILETWPGTLVNVTRFAKRDHITQKSKIELATPLYCT